MSSDSRPGRYKSAGLIVWGVLHVLWPVVLFARPTVSRSELLVSIVVGIVVGPLVIAAGYDKLPTGACFSVGVIELLNVGSLIQAASSEAFFFNIAPQAAGEVAVMNLVVVVLLFDRGLKTEIKTISEVFSPDSSETEVQ